MTQILKPCPFCAIALEEWGEDAFHHPGAVDCPLDDLVFEDRDMGAWNTRHSDPDELREALVEFVEADNRDKEIAVLRSALARVVAKDVIHGTPKHEFVQAVADLTLIADAEDIGGDLTGYWKELLETLRNGAQRILNRTALSRNVGDVG